MYYSKILLFVLTFYSFVDEVAVIGVDVDLTLDRTGWIDPNDPLARPGRNSHRIKSSDLDNGVCDSHCEQLTQDNERLQRMYESLKNSREHSVDVLLKHILGKFILSLGIDLNSSEDVFKNAHVFLSAENLRIVRRYLSSKKNSEEFGLREDLRFALEEFITESASEPAYITSLRLLFPYIAMLNLAILPIAVWMILRSIFSIRQLIIVVLIAAFSISCYSTYTRKYKEVLAQRFERVEKKFDGQCTSDGIISEAYNLVLSYVKIKDKSECLQHYEDVLIEPIWLIDPLQVVAEVGSNFVLTPISVAGGHFNKFFNDFFINTPIFLTIVKCVFLLLLLFYLTGYRIRTIFATIEPAAPISRLVPQSLTYDQSISTRSLNLQRDCLMQPDCKVQRNCLMQSECVVQRGSSVKPDAIVAQQENKLQRDCIVQPSNTDDFKWQELQEELQNWRRNFQTRQNYLDSHFDDSKVTHRRTRGEDNSSFFNDSSVTALKRSFSLCRL